LLEFWIRHEHFIQRDAIFTYHVARPNVAVLPLGLRTLAKKPPWLASVSLAAIHLEVHYPSLYPFIFSS
jgi:hypothetical protein